MKIWRASATNGSASACRRLVTQPGRVLVHRHRRPERVVDLPEQTDGALAGILHAGALAGCLDRGARAHGVRDLEVTPLSGMIDSRPRDQRLGSGEVAESDGRVGRDHPRLGDAVVGWSKLGGN